MNSRTRNAAQVGLFAALTVMAIYLFRIPGPGGNVYFHLGETVMMSAAVILGAKRGAFVGAVASAAADLLLGAALWAPFSLVIHGAECWLIGKLCEGKGTWRDFTAMAIGGGVMIAGYTLTAGLLYGAAVMPVEFTGDLAQAFLGVATAFPLTRAVLKRFPEMKRG